MIDHLASTVLSQTMADSVTGNHLSTTIASQSTSCATRHVTGNRHRACAAWTFVVRSLGQFCPSAQQRILMNFNENSKNKRKGKKTTNGNK